MNWKADCGASPRSRFTEERATQRIAKGFEQVVLVAALRFLLIPANSTLKKRSAASSSNAAPPGPSANPSGSVLELAGCPSILFG
jgi:hypothetical protein